MDKKDKFYLYVLDTETTGLALHNSVVEISIIRYADKSQKTWFIRADEDPSTIQEEALRVNGHKYEDILWKTAYGKEAYIEPKQAIVEIENWLMEDGIPSDKRIITGQNVSGFDKDRILNMWKKYDQEETFPFNKRLTMDTLQIELFLSFCFEDYNEKYSLSNLVEKYKVKKLKAHRAADDSIMTLNVFDKQVERLKTLIK